MYYRIADKECEAYVEGLMFRSLPTSTKILMKNAFIKAFLYGLSTQLGVDIPTPPELNEQPIPVVDFDGLL